MSNRRTFREDHTARCGWLRKIIESFEHKILHHFFRMERFSQTFSYIFFVGRASIINCRFYGFISVLFKLPIHIYFLHVYMFIKTHGSIQSQNFDLLCGSRRKDSY